jgi:hypothetical protein
MNSPISDLLADRALTHGPFASVSACAQQTKSIWRSQPNWSKLSDAQREALEAIAGKVARILNGDPSFDDHWIDGAGYFQLGSRS